MPTFKQIEAMAYGSPEQTRAADRWYFRLMKFRSAAHEEMMDAIWNRVHHSDVGYEARQRFVHMAMIRNSD
jgi:hypothetical protein